MHSQYPSLSRIEAIHRRSLLSDVEYDLRLDLTGEATFASHTTIRFQARAGQTFLDVRPLQLRSVRLDGDEVDVETWHGGRLSLSLREGWHELVVESTMSFRTDGEGLHRSRDPADGEVYVYAMSFLDATPTIFACFDQPDLKAPYALHVRVPDDWVVIGNAPCRQGEDGTWEFERSEAIPTYLFSIVAGPYHVIEDQHDDIPLGLSVRASMARHLDRDADELFTLTKQGFAEFHRLFGVRYPFGKYHQAFVPELTVGAMENPGCVTLRDSFIFSSRPSRSQQVSRATTMAHEMAHQWFGDLVTPVWWDDLWLNESFAEYLGARVTAVATRYDDAWVEAAYSRWQWGLMGDQSPSTHPVAGNGARDCAEALQAFDGISYVKGCALVRQLNQEMGDTVFLAGVRDHLDRHRFRNATMHDLVAAWIDAGARNLAAFTTDWLGSAGVDRLEVDREAQVIRRTRPKQHPAHRRHALKVAVETSDGWTTRSVVLDADETPFDVADQPVLLDPNLTAWAVTPTDEITVQALVDVLPTMTDPLLRAGAWSGVRSAFHNASIDPGLAFELVLAAPPIEDYDDTGSRTMAWVYDSVLPLQEDRASATARLHEALRARLAIAPGGSEMQLAAFRACVATAGDAGTLERWASGALPEGVRLDLDLRWRVMARMAELGAVGLHDIDEHLASEQTGAAQIWHARTRASLPDPEAKAWAWSCFQGSAEVGNHELEAAGTGMWRTGQEALTSPYVARFFREVPTTAAFRSGGILGATVRAFFPRNSVDPVTVDLARRTLGSAGLDPAIARQLADQVDLLERRLACLARRDSGRI